MKQPTEEKIKAYILTRIHNEYDQYGKYFVAWFTRLPTVAEIKLAVKRDDGSEIDDTTALHILSGGGRRHHENVWWYLDQVRPANRKDYPAKKKTSSLEFINEIIEKLEGPRIVDQQAAAVMLKDWQNKIANNQINTCDEANLDATDQTHPAYWRGSEEAVAGCAAHIRALCAGDKEDAGVSYPDWESARQAVITLRKLSEKQRLAIDAAVKALESYEGEINFGKKQIKALSQLRAVQKGTK